MSTTPTPPGEETRDHVIARFSGAALRAFERVATAPAWSMSPAEQRTTLLELDRLTSALAELRLRLLAAADKGDVGAECGASSTAGWVAHATRQVRPSVSSDVRLAKALDERFELTRAAMASGRVNPDQARVIVHAVDDLPDDLEPEWRARAEAHLVESAGEVDAKTLRILGRRILDVLDPDAADEHEGRKLEDEERRARRATYLNLRDNGDGTHSGTFKIPDLHAAMLTKALQALAAPRRVGEARYDPASGRKRPYAELLGQAFCELVERYPTDRLPSAGGNNASIVVTIPWDFLLRGIGAATLDDGTRISAAEARRLACDAGIIPLVLGGESEPLDIGRERRFHTRHQRLALAHRDRGCRADGCDRPPSWTEAHHEMPWSRGGPTDLAHGGLRCFHHHQLEHDDAYDKTMLPNGRIRYHRRT